MKPRLAVMTLLLAALLTGCSFVEEVNHSLQYATEATEYLNEAHQFAQDVPTLAQRATLDPASLETLQQELDAMRTSITDFNVLQAPSVAEDLHNQLTAYNDKLLVQIEQYSRQISDRTIDLEALAHSPMLETVRSMTDLMSQLEHLGL